ncbi:MAG TPA: hypothetical protein PKO23_04170, partial [Candidatus Hydrogenedentes bacterium]|nr:hypothetical protein [Candidatus Hydrogenedentota bacterium]
MKKSMLVLVLGVLLLAGSVSAQTCFVAAQPVCAPVCKPVCAPAVPVCTPVCAPVCRPVCMPKPVVVAPCCCARPVVCAPVCCKTWCGPICRLKRIFCRP